MSDPNLKFLPISKDILKDIDQTNIDNWTKLLLPHPILFWEFWNLDEELKYNFVSLATIWNEEGLIKPELLVINDGVDEQDALAHIEKVVVPNVWILHDEVGIRAASYLISLWFTKESAHSELQRLLGNHHG